MTYHYIRDVSTLQQNLTPYQIFFFPTHHYHPIVMAYIQMSPKALCSHRWSFTEVSGPTVCDAGIKNVMLEFIHDAKIKRVPP